MTDFDPNAENLTISPTYTTIPETPGARIRLERIELVPGFCGQVRKF